MTSWSPCSATARSCDCTHDEIPDKGTASTSVPIRPARSGLSAMRCRPCIDRFSPHDGFDPRASGSEVHSRRKHHALVVEEEMRPRGVTLCPHLPPKLVHVARLEVDVGMIWGLVLPWHRRSSYEPDAPARGVPQSPRWRVGLVCAKDAKLSCRGNIPGHCPELLTFAANGPARRPPVHHSQTDRPEMRVLPW